MDTANYLEEYKTLRNEIARHQESGIKVTQFGLTVSVALFTLAYSTIIPSSTRWLVIFAPWFVASTLVLYQIQLVLAASKIGRYIQLYLEPRLGLHWETVSFNFSLKGEDTNRLKSLLLLWWGPLAPYMALLIIQILCPVLSFLENPPNLIIWMAPSILVSISMLFQVTIILRMPRESLLQRMQNVIITSLENKQ